MFIQNKNLEKRARRVQSLESGGATRYYWVYAPEAAE